MPNIIELKYSNTNTYLVEGKNGVILFDTGWAGTFNDFCRAIRDSGYTVQSIDYILISHFHPDHMGIAQDIADQGSVIVVLDNQRSYIHYADSIFDKDKKIKFTPIIDEKVRVISAGETRDFLSTIGINGEIIMTPGHSDDSISLCLDEGYIFVGDLNPLYELEMHKGTLIEESWKKLLSLNPGKIFYGHAKTLDLKGNNNANYKSNENDDKYSLVSAIIKYINKGYSMDKIRKKTGADMILIEDVNRMYLTHQNIGVQGILDRIEIKGM